MPGIKIEILNYKEIEAKLNKLPIEAADMCAGEVQDYLLNVMKTDQPSPNYVSRASAYPGDKITLKSGREVVGFQSLRQYYYVLYLYATGKIPYRRTQELSRGWHIVNRGLLGYLVNYTKGASYVVGERNQANQPRMVGWKKASQQIEDRMAKINKIIDGAAKKAIKKLGLS